MLFVRYGFRGTIKHVLYFYCVRYTTLATRIVFKPSSTWERLVHNLFRWVWNCDITVFVQVTVRIAYRIFSVYRPHAFTVMAGKIGRLEPFDSAIETWDLYHERLEQHFICNEVKAEKKVPLFTLIGGNTYSLLRGLTRPKKTVEITYGDIVATLQKICIRSRWTFSLP